MIAKSFSILFIIILNEMFTDLVDSLYSGHQRFTKNKQNLKCSSSNSLPPSTNNFKTKWVIWYHNLCIHIYRIYLTTVYISFIYQVQHQLPRSYITVSVLEAADMDYYLEKAIDEELVLLLKKNSISIISYHICNIISYSLCIYLVSFFRWSHMVE